MSNTVYDIANVRACITCVIAQENGDTSQLTDEQRETWISGCAGTSAPLIAKGWRWSGVQCDSVDEYGERCDCDGENPEHSHEGWFSWSPCEWCGDTDGGQRFNVAIMKRLPIEN
jgi:hypothetical protein